MTLFFSTVLNEIYDAWLPNREINKIESMFAADHTRSKLSIINSVYKTISVPANIKNKAGKPIHVKNDDVRGLFDGTKQPDEKIVANRNHILVEQEMPKVIAEEIIKYLDQNKIDLFINKLLTAVLKDAVFDDHVKSDVEQSASRSKLAYFLMRVIRLSLERENGKPVPIELLVRKETNSHHTSVKTSGNVPTTISETSDIGQAIYKKSCEIYSQLTNNYTIVESLIPHLSADISDSNCQIIGDGGTGKTTYLITQFKKLLNSYKEGSQNNPIPIYIPLNQYLGRAVHGEYFIKNYIATNYAGVCADKFQWESCNFLLMLDGANESPYTSQLGKEIEELVNIGCKMLITSRYKLEWNCLKSFSCVKLNELDDETIKQVLAKERLPMAEGRLLQTLRRPMWLTLYSGLKNVKGINTPGEILREHHNWLLSKVSSDLQGEEYTDQYHNALEYISKLANLAKSTVFNTKDIDNDIQAFLPNTLPFDTFLRIAVSSGLLKLIGPDSLNGGVVYQWTHECYLEYYKAYSIFSALKKNIVPSALESGPLSPAVASFLGDLFQEYFFEAKSSCNSDMSPVEVWLQEHMRHDDIGSEHTDECRQMTTRNLIEVMKIARRNHITACYDGLDLSLAHFYDCTLPNSSFDNSIIPESTLISQGHTSRIRHLAYLQENNLLVTAGDDNLVLFWNTKTSTVKRRVKTPSRIAGLDVSPDSMHILILLEIGRPAIMIVSATGDSDNSKDIQINATDESVKYSFAKFTADSTRVICASERGIIHILDAETGGLVCPAIQLEQGIYDAPFEYGISSNRQFLVNGTTGGDIDVRRISNLGKPTTTLAYSPEDDHHVHNIAFTRNGKYCVVKNYDHLVAWILKLKEDNPGRKTVSKELDLGNFMFQLVPTENGVFFFDHGSNRLHFWDIPNNRFIGKDFPCNLCCMVLSTDSKLLVLADEKGKIYFVNPTYFESVHTMWVGYTPRKSHYLHNRHHLGSKDVLFRRTWAGFFELYNRKKSQFARIPIQPDPLLDTTTVPFWENWYCVDGYLCYVDGSICSIWSMSSGNHVQDIELKGYRIDAVIPQKDLIVGCNYLDSDYPICLWTLSTGKPLALLDTHGTWVCGMPINPELIKIQSGNFGNKMSKFANVYGLKKEYFTHATFSDLGIVVGGTGNGTIRIWDLSSQQLIHEENIAASRITKLTPLKKSTVVVIQSENHSVIIYDVAARCCMGCWMDNANVLRNVRFLKFITCDNCNHREELVERDVIGTTVYRLNLESGTLVSYNEGKHDENIAVSQNGEWMAVNKFLQLPLPYKLFLYSVHSDEMVSIPLTKHKLWPNCAFSPSCDGKHLLLSNEAGAVCLLDSTTGEQAYEWAVCDAKDICGCAFENAILEGSINKRLIQMNGGNL